MNGIAALAGNPNCGKTTLFNALTGAHQYVGNWPGVTVDKREAIFDVNDAQITLIDLPGAYSLTPYSIEERVTADYLSSGEANAVINIVDAMHLERSLLLTLQLLHRRLPVIVAVNMMDELTREGGRIDIPALSQALGCPVVAISARHKTGFDELFSALYQAIAHPKAPAVPDADREEDEEAFYRRAFVLLKTAGYRKRRSEGRDRTARLDRILTGRYTAFPILLSVLLLMFFLAFGAPGAYLTGLVGSAVDRLRIMTLWLLRRQPTWISSLIADGILAGAGSVLGFLPQILILYLLMAIIEDTGYMARAAFITDRLLRRLGLSGRSVIPMLMGLGCTTTAAAAARGVENERDRRMTVMLTPCMSCGAKLPVYALMARSFFPGHEAVVVLSLYLLGGIMLAIMGTCLRRLVFREGETPFLMELPAYRMPVWRSVGRRLYERARDFIRRAGTLIVLLSAVCWFLQAFTPTLKLTAHMDTSIMACVGRWLAPLFKPMGFGSWQAVSCLLSGLVAKEGILSALQVLLHAPGAAALMRSLPTAFCGAAGAYAFLAFILISPPCISAISASARELKSPKLLITMLVMETAFAALLSIAAYQALRFIL